jgi:hypothetical protein
MANDFEGQAEGASHPGPVLVVIQSGTFTLYNGYDKHCKRDVYAASSAFVDPGNGYIHIGRNEGTEPVELSATYLLPVGAGPRNDVTPAPGSCPF